MISRFYITMIFRGKPNNKTRIKKIAINKTPGYKSEKQRKNHISHILRNDPRRFRIIAFSQILAATKIQHHYRAYKEYKIERVKIQFDHTIKRILKNYARAVIRKYTRLYLLERKEKREWLEFHNIYNIDEIVHIQTKWRALKERPKKLNVKRFKDVLYSTLIGWRIRRIISYMKTLPEIKESIDFAKLRSDLDDNPTDMFSLQIIAQFPEKISVFLDKFKDLYENAVWIKKPNVKVQTKQRKPFMKANSKRTDFNKTTKPSRGTQKKEQKPQLQKAKTFKGHKPEILKPDIRKYPSERQPKQSQRLSKKNSKANMNNIESKAKN
jgi:hypothetical protein